MNSTDRELSIRLDQISTRWSMIFQAHAQPGPDSESARRSLLLRYHAAVFRYLLALVRDLDVAEDLSHDFAVRVMDGNFHRANPDRGRFRDYVKTSVINAVRKYYREAAERPNRLPAELADSAADCDLRDADSVFVEVWREDILNQTWQALAIERPAYHNILRLRIDEPELTSRQLAESYRETYGKPMTAVNIRKTLPRAQAKFAELLVAEVASLLDEPTRDDVHSELSALGLLKYCHSGLERWQPVSGEHSRS